MSTFIVEGGHRMHGDITHRCQNEALQIICATLLTPERVVIENVPDILDINNLISLLAEMGCKVERLSPIPTPYRPIMSISNIFRLRNTDVAPPLYEDR